MNNSDWFQLNERGVLPARIRPRALLTAVALSIALVACASSDSVQRVQAGDENLSCEKLTAAMQEADKFRADAQGKKGVTGTNTAAALLFWPALLVTYSDANAAIAAADTRKLRLAELRREKGCL